jgi:hypothetical protein
VRAKSPRNSVAEDELSWTGLLPSVIVGVSASGDASNSDETGFNADGGGDDDDNDDDDDDNDDGEIIIGCGEADRDLSFESFEGVDNFI